MELDADRICKILVKSKVQGWPPEGKRGTGYAISDRLVLTCMHIFPDDPEADCTIQIWINSGESKDPQFSSDDETLQDPPKILWSGRAEVDSDAALVSCDLSESFPPTMVPLLRQPNSLPLAWHSRGFAKMEREHAGIKPFPCYGSDFHNSERQPFFTITTNNGPPEHLAKALWKGMSGSAVCCAKTGKILGVITQFVPGTDGNGLSVVPLPALFKDSKFWEHCSRHSSARYEVVEKEVCSRVESLSADLRSRLHAEVCSSSRDEYSDDKRLLSEEITIAMMCEHDAIDLIVKLDRVSAHAASQNQSGCREVAEICDWLLPLNYSEAIPRVQRHDVQDSLNKGLVLQLVTTSTLAEYLMADHDGAHATFVESVRDDLVGMAAIDARPAEPPNSGPTGDAAIIHETVQHLSNKIGQSDARVPPPSWQVALSQLREELAARREDLAGRTTYVIVPDTDENVDSVVNLSAFQKIAETLRDKDGRPLIVFVQAVPIADESTDSENRLRTRYRRIRSRAPRR